MPDADLAAPSGAGAPRPGRSPSVLRCLVSLASAIALIGAGQLPEEGAALADRIVAVVDDDPILASDMERLIRLGLVEPAPGESREDFERRVLEELIVTRLRIHEVDRFGSQDLPLAQVEAQVREVRQRFADEQSYRAALDELGLTPEQLREILARQLMVMSFVEERLGPAVFVSLDDISLYYEEVLKPEMRRRGESPPELRKVREEIRAVLREQRLNEEIESWTEDLRRRADIADYLESASEGVPPRVE